MASDKIACKNSIDFWSRVAGQAQKKMIRGTGFEEEKMTVDNILNATERSTKIHVIRKAEIMRFIFI